MVCADFFQGAVCPKMFLCKNTKMVSKCTIYKEKGFITSKDLPRLNLGVLILLLGSVVNLDAIVANDDDAVHLSPLDSCCRKARRRLPVHRLHHHRRPTFGFTQRMVLFLLC